MSSFLMRSVTVLAAVFAMPAMGEDVDLVGNIPNAPTVGDAAEETDETQKLIKQLTIAMSAEVIDERTFAIRDSSKGSKLVHLSLGNVGPTPRGSLDDGEYAEKVKVAKEALAKLVDKQMIWYKIAPEASQSANSTGTVPVVIADVWSIDGRHVSSALKKDGHLSYEQVYESDLAKDILTVASEEEKKESYKKLEEALKESELAKQEAAKAARAKAEAEEDAENIESIGFAGWLAVMMFLVIALGAATNFGRPSNKKVNLNRKRGSFERFCLKLKGH